MFKQPTPTLSALFCVFKHLTVGWSVPLNAAMQISAGKCASSLSCGRRVKGTEQKQRALSVKPKMFRQKPDKYILKALRHAKNH